VLRLKADQEPDHSETPHAPHRPGAPAHAGRHA
jgi:hypothetical protein